MQPNRPLISIVVITRDRPVAMLAQTLEALARQSWKPLETLVVDTSPGAEIPRMAAAKFPQVRVLHIPDGPRCMPWSRNQGVAATSDEIVAFVDDDAIAAPQWASEMVRAYDGDHTVGGVGGRIIEGVDLGGNWKPHGVAVASLNRQGIPVADFNSVTGAVVPVEHLKGCNMSFRRSALAQVGGFDEFYTGIANREETDLCVRIRRAGYRLLYNPNALVDHKTFSLFAEKRMLLERVNSGYPMARLDGYYVAKNFGARAWLQWYVSYNARAFGRAFKATYMAFARASLGLGGGAVGLMQAVARRSAVSQGAKAAHTPLAETPAMPARHGE